jgi:hypothetical protein
MAKYRGGAEGHDRLLRHHPLRIYETSEVPSSVPEADKVFATMKANQKNLLVGFFIEGRLRFVERFADYDDRVAALKNGAVRRITAILVGELGNLPASTLAEFWSWFPFELCLLWGHMQLRLLVPVFLQRSLLLVFCIALNSCQSHKANSGPSIEFTHIPPAAQGGRERVDTISGRVRNDRTKQQIVIYAHCEPWWVQPWPPYLGS